MGIELVRNAMEQSRERAPEVRAMVLLRGSRVLAAVDREEAKAAFTEGLAMVRALSLDVHFSESILGSVAELAAHFDPARAISLFRSLGSSEFGQAWRFGRLVDQLALSGYVEEALSLLEDMTLSGGPAAMSVVQLAKDPAVQKRALRATRERWRRYHREPHQMDAMPVMHLFNQHRDKLDLDEQRSWLDEILLTIETEPDFSGTYDYGPEVMFESQRESVVFQLLGPLRALKNPEEVAAILERYPAVAKAAERYPLGMQSLLEESRAKAAARPAGGMGCGINIGGIGVGGWNAESIELRRALVRGDPAAIDGLLAEAHQQFLKEKDVNNPNMAPLPFWKSCATYETAMYHAGKIKGGEAESYLAQVPDTDLALLGSIALAAGQLGLSLPSRPILSSPGRHCGRAAI